MKAIYKEMAILGQVVLTDFGSIIIPESVPPRILKDTCKEYSSKQPRLVWFKVNGKKWRLTYFQGAKNADHGDEFGGKVLKHG